MAIYPAATWCRPLIALETNRDRERLPELLGSLIALFNIEQTEGLRLRSLQTAPPAWEGHERAEAIIRNSGVRVDHVAGDRAYYRLSDDRVVLPERSQFDSQAAYTHTALHELGHATGHPEAPRPPEPAGGITESCGSRREAGGVPFRVNNAKHPGRQGRGEGDTTHADGTRQQERRQPRGRRRAHDGVG